MIGLSISVSPQGSAITVAAPLEDHAPSISCLARLPGEDDGFCAGGSAEFGEHVRHTVIDDQLCRPSAMLFHQGVSRNPRFRVKSSTLATQPSTPSIFPSPWVTNS